MGSFSVWHWLIVLVVVMLVFGTKKLGNMGSDLGKAVKGFKDGIKGEEDTAAQEVSSSKLAHAAAKDAAQTVNAKAVN